MVPNPVAGAVGGSAIGDERDFKRRQHQAISVDPQSTKWMATTFKSGLDRELVLAVLEREKPGLAAFMDVSNNSGGGGGLGVDFSQIAMSSYRLRLGEVKDKTGGGGGMAVYVHKDLDGCPLEDLNSELIETSWFKVQQKEGQTLVGVVRYDPDQLALVPYLRNAIKKGLSKMPEAEVMVIGDLGPSGVESSLDFQAGVTADLGVHLPTLKLNITFHSSGKKYYFVIKGDYFRDSSDNVQDLAGSLGQDFLIVEHKRKYCPICLMHFKTDLEFYEHRRTQSHKTSYFAHSYHLRRPELINSSYQLAIEPERVDDQVVHEVDKGLITFKVTQNATSRLTLKLANKQPPTAAAAAKQGLIVKAMEFMIPDEDVTLSDDLGGITKVEPSEREDRVRRGVRVLSGQAFKFFLDVRRRSLNQHKMILMVTFLSEVDKKIAFMAKEILVLVSNDDLKAIKPVAPYVRPKFKKNLFGPGRPEPGIKFVMAGGSGGQSSDVLRSANKRLDEYKTSADMEKLLRFGLKPFPNMTREHCDLLNAVKRLLDGGRLDASNCRERFKILLQAEEEQMKIDIRSFDMQGVSMKAAHSNLLELDVPGLAENRPSVLRGDEIIVQFSHEAPNAKKYTGTVHQVLDKSVRLGLSPGLRSRHLPNLKYDVRFTVNRYPLKIMYRALELATPDFLSTLLFPSTAAAIPSAKPEIKVNSFFNRNIESNPEQQKAVRHIVSGGVPGIPYIIFGPPGTGKTVTMVESIKQVWRLIPGSKILATAPSNAATDVLTTRIIDHIPPSQILRYYAPSRDESKVPAAIKKVSNLVQSTSSVEDVSKYRVVIMTLVTSGRLSLAQLPKGHYTHVFIDEAGHATEPEALIPISGLLANGAGSLVMAGDPKQLGPVIRAPVALGHGLQTSMLERLMNTCPVYRRDPATGSYDERCITKLLKSFRSHRALLKLPSQLFYDDELVTAADPVVVTSLENYHKLPTPGFPLIFHGLMGRDQKEANSPSYFNGEEVCTVVDYIQDLLSLKNPRIMPKDIGVISPYRKQISKIKDLINTRYQRNKQAFSGKEWRDVTIASTEEFQGQERRVMIISTVRSEENYLKEDYKFKLGFLKNPKRFNVALTRAKALMIVVGNPKILCLDAQWKAFIRYAQLNGAFKCDFQFKLDDPAVDLNMREMQIKFENWGLQSEVGTTTSNAYRGGTATTLTLDGGDGGSGYSPSASSFDSLSEVPTHTTESFGRLGDEYPELHEDVPERSHFDQ